MRTFTQNAGQYPAEETMCRWRAAMDVCGCCGAAPRWAQHVRAYSAVASMLQSSMQRGAPKLGTRAHQDVWVVLLRKDSSTAAQALVGLATLRARIACGAALQGANRRQRGSAHRSIAAQRLRWSALTASAPLWW